jgi:hypothetical protein
MDSDKKIDPIKISIIVFIIIIIISLLWYFFSNNEELCTDKSFDIDKVINDIHRRQKQNFSTIAC